MFSFFNHFSLGNILVADGATTKTQRILKALLGELPELLMACAVEVPSGKMLTSYTTQPRYDHNHISLAYARLVRSGQDLGRRLTHEDVVSAERPSALVPQGRRHSTLNRCQPFRQPGIPLPDTGVDSSS